ncbi:phosphate ABC transporter permease subunit PstC [Halobacteria archaeon AArc-m2/3/4]|uniref:Phosphate transport system permease protein n=1 Tax=Natronoglomus mannanivorans TaxID=2979990 RepID=A0AAP3E2Y9_9EURY|nr:phosphate ABC transporter permease subunit PstC [Halobacteria archaeon AArc-xg1-1]MCU4973886.1 phosphate ABC transporter permease subunit PstC [Halobacteria archaeon AArc-m2/3/4]
MSTDSPNDSAITGDVARADRIRNRHARRLLFTCASVTVITTVAIFAVLIDNAFSYFYGVTLHDAILGVTFEQQVSFSEFLTGTRWAPDHARPAHGVLPIVYGTLAITVGAAFVSIPIGTATAIYLSEYASPAVRSKLKPTLEVLAGIPTIVYGFFAISFITPLFISPLGNLFGHHVGRYNMLAGCIVVGIMTIPMVSSISEDAMSSVPDELRNGAYALGATKFDVSTKVVLPASISGVFASYILAVSRAIGETMAVTLAAGFQAQITGNPFDEIMTMTAYMVSMARGESAVGTVEYQSLFAVGLVLFVMTLTMNLLNDWIKRRYREEYQ